jgi:hypothetical protein
MPILAIFSFWFVNSHAMYVISIVPVDLAGNSSDAWGSYIVFLLLQMQRIVAFCLKLDLRKSEFKPIFIGTVHIILDLHCL